MALPDDMVLFASAGMPSDNSATSGGAIDLDTRLEFTQPTSVPTLLEAVSSAAGDTTQTITVRALDANEAVVSQTVTLTGTTSVDLNTLGQIVTILKVNLSADCAGIVTLRTDPGMQTIGTIPIGERGFLALHREGTASASATEDFYYKGFWKNTGAGTLTSPLLEELADPAARCTFAVAAAINDSVSVANRKTAPALTFNNNAKSSPSNLAAGDAVGVWFKFSHPAAEADQSTTVTNHVGGGS